MQYSEVLTILFINPFPGHDSLTAHTLGDPNGPSDEGRLKMRDLEEALTLEGDLQFPSTDPYEFEAMDELNSRLMTLAKLPLVPVFGG